LLYDGMIVIISQTTPEGCESVDLLTVEVVLSPQPEGPLADSPQLFCSADMPTIADLAVTITIPGSYLTWYDDVLMSNPPLDSTESLVDGVSYFVTQTGSEGCESLPTEIVAEITITPEAPEGDALQEFCATDYPTVADLAVNNTNMVITWYDAAGYALNDTDALEDGVSYYATQTSIEAPYCESIGQFEVVVTLSEPIMPSGEVTQEFCKGDFPTVADLIVDFDSGDTINWYDAPEGGTIYESTDLLEEGMYYVEAVNNGCASERFAVEVVFDPEECGIIPDAFSPNGDDLNEVWEIPLLYNYLNFRLEIYDRWGNLVYDYDNNGAMEPTWWNGMSNGRLNFQDGKPVPAGTYFYLVDFNDTSREPKTGWVFLNR
ncbi:MAG: gliding motility-associated C-terminal domain-containing protein, partial [Bacteroidota bacterium]